MVTKVADGGNDFLRCDQSLSAGVCGGGFGVYILLEDVGSWRRGEERQKKKPTTNIKVSGLYIIPRVQSRALNHLLPPLPSRHHRIRNPQHRRRSRFLLAPALPWTTKTRRRPAVLPAPLRENTRRRPRTRARRRAPRCWPNLPPEPARSARSVRDACSWPA